MNTEEDIDKKNTTHSALLFLRDSIDNIDSAILSILFHRAQIINNITKYKKAHRISPKQSQLRRDTIFELVEFSSSLNLSSRFTKAFFEQLYKDNDHFCDSKTHDLVIEFFLSKENLLEQFNDSLKYVDISLCSLLSERMHLVKQVGEYKKAKHIQPLAKSRWEAVLKTKINMAQAQLQLC